MVTQLITILLVSVSCLGFAQCMSLVDFRRIPFAGGSFFVRACDVRMC